MGRLFRPSLAAAVLLAAVPTAGALGVGDDLEACRTPGQVEVRKDNWAKLNAPTPLDADEGEKRIVDFTAPPQQKRWVYVTNGKVVKLSADAGCTWTTVFTGLTDRVPEAAHEREIFTHVASPGGRSVWVAGYDDVQGVPRPHVFQTGDAAPQETEPSFNQVENGLPPVGLPLDLEVSARDPGAAYLLLEQPPDPSSGDVQAPSRRLYTTRNIDEPQELRVVGMRWTEMAPPPGFGRIDGFTMSPFSRTVWIWSGNKFAVTNDADADQIPWVEGSVEGAILTIDATSLGVNTVVERTGQGAFARTVEIERGQTKVSSPRRLPIVPTAFAHGVRPGVLVAAGEGRVYGWDIRAKRWADITPAGVPTFAKVETAAGSTNRIVLGETADGLYRFDMYPGETFLRPKAITAVGDPNNPEFPTSPLTEPVLTPKRHVITVRPGELKDAPVQFGVPPTTTPLDVFFIVDTTTSMSASIRNLQAGIHDIAANLRRMLGKAACFGVGDVKDATAATVTSVYRVHQKITCNDPDFSKIDTALKQLRESGGGDPPEAQTIALDQAVRGTGLVNPFVAEKQDANFRPEAFKVIVMITDAPFKQGPEYPSIEAVTGTLRAAEVKVVSILVLNNGDSEGARRDMTELAEGTETFAPPSGVDCDGDGALTPGYDLAPGEPLICETSGSEPNVAPAIVGLLLGVTDPGELEVKVDDRHRVIRKIRGQTTRYLDLKREGRVGFIMTVSCTPAQDGLNLPIGLDPSVRDLPTGLHGEVVVECRSVPVVPPPPPVIEPDPVFEVLVPPRPPVPAVAIQFPPNPPPQPPANVNPNAGFSQQEEEQFQVATVTQESAEQGDEEAVELAMSSLERRQSDAASYGFALGSAALLSAAAAVGMAQRRRTQQAARPSYARR